MTKNLAKQILQANIEYHSKMGKDYSKQPHINRKNTLRFKKILNQLAKETTGKTLLDIGCGPGFVIDIAKNIFSEVVGLDITPAMLDLVKKAKNVETVLAESSKMPLEDNSFDVCVSSSFLHHLYSIEPTLKEVYRVLKKGGVFFNDLDPNYYYFNQLKTITHDSNLPQIITREEGALQELYNLHQEKYNNSKKTVDLCEYQRQKGGMKEEAVRKALQKAGFQDIKIFYFWYVGQGQIEKNSPALAYKFNNYLKDLLPVSRNLYKYFGFFAKK